MTRLNERDRQVAAAMQQELQRQRDKIELIASENFVSEAVMDAMGSVLTNKYAEGYPGRRYYGGCEYVDVVETIAQERAKALFGAEYVNVQPHSGAQANMAVYFAFLSPGDTVLGMNLSHGGHLTHGSSVNFSGKLYHFVSYGVDEQTQTINYDEVRRLALEHQPKMLVAGASAYPRVIDFASMRAIADEVGAYLLVDMAHIAGLVATGHHPSPIPHAHFTTTTTHKTLRGPRGGMILSKAEYAKALDKSIFPGVQGGPLMHVIAAKAVSFGEALQPEFRDYSGRVIENAAALAQNLVSNGFQIVSGGTDNHLILIDVRNCNLTGKEAEHRLDEIGVTVNKNTIPFDSASPMVTSGIRIGTPAVTTRGMDVPAMAEIAEIFRVALKTSFSDTDKADARNKVEALTSRFPMYPGLSYSE